MRIAVIGGRSQVWSTCLIRGITSPCLKGSPFWVDIFGHSTKRYPKPIQCDEILENGVLNFLAFHNFLALMQELGVELEPVDIGSALFLKDGSHFLSGS